MENPATWGKAEKIIDQELFAHNIEEGLNQGRLVGPSLARKIADALRGAGLLDTKEAPDG